MASRSGAGQPLRIGVLGTAKIAREKVLPAIERADGVEVVAIASRDATVARDVARTHHVPLAFGSYEELLACDEVDAVYVPLPNHLHVPWSVQALEAGKHVLCEKPIAIDAAGVRPLVQAAERHPHLVVMEAFMYRFHPQWLTTRAWISEGRIGALRSVDVRFAYRNVDPTNVRNVPAWGGGGLLDIGCYGVSVARFLFGREPVRVAGILDVDPSFGVDRLATATLDFGQGDVATFQVATQQEPFQRVHAFGTDGWIEVQVPFNPPPTGPTRVVHHAGRDAHVLDCGGADAYALQVQAFARAITLRTASPVPVSEALANMRVLDAVREASATASWVEVSR